MLPITTKNPLCTTRHAQLTGFSQRGQGNTAQWHYSCIAMQNSEPIKDLKIKEEW